MAGKVKAIPDQYGSITPHLTVRNAEEAIKFYQRAFNAEALSITKGPDNKGVMHAELKIGNSILMLNDEFQDWNVLSPLSFGGTGVTIHLYVENVDAMFQQAVDAGAAVRMPVGDSFWGDRYGQLVDPFGHQWSLATHIEDLSQEEILKRRDAALAEMCKEAGSPHAVN